MTRIRLDKVQLSSFTEAYRNYEKLTSTIVISGTVNNLTIANFSTTFTPSRSNVIADIYATNQNTGVKMTLNAGSIHNPYQAVSTENNPVSISYVNGVITVTLSVENFTGANINLTSQTWTITVVLYDVPY